MREELIRRIGHRILTLVAAQLCVTVGLCSMQQRLLRRIGVGLFALPELNHCGLQRTAVAEGELPGLRAGHTVDGIQISRSVEFRLAAGEKGDSCKPADYSVFDALRDVPGTAGGTLRRKAVTVAWAICS